MNLSPYTPSASKPWNRERVQHLYSRLGFGANNAEITTALTMSPTALVEQLINAAKNAVPPSAPYWANYTDADYDAQSNPDLAGENQAEMYRRWMIEMINEPIRAKMSLFWHNHFVTAKDVYGCNSYMWAYWNLLHVHSYGNFKIFVEAIGVTPAMLVYLNGNQNFVSEPNENYARELMELFTMGESNGYTQADIPEVARALTGWHVDMYECTPPYYIAADHDNNVKTIFGTSANFNYTSLHNLIFAQRNDEVAYHICEKIYTHFVYNTPDTAVINELATTFKVNWDISAVMKELFKSNHFFESRIINSKIKSPFEAFINMVRMSGAVHPTHVSDNYLNAMLYWCSELGQRIFNPINVAGWAGQRVWVNENTLTKRWKFNGDQVYGYFTTELKNSIRDMTITLTNTSSNPTVICDVLAKHFLNTTLKPEHLEVAVEYFKSGIPDNYFDDGSWNLYWDEAPFQIVNLLGYFIKLPEYQLV